MKDYIKTSIDKMFSCYGYPQSFKDSMYKVNEHVSDFEINKLLSTYQRAEDFDVDKISAIAQELSEKYKIHRLTLNLYCLVCLVPKLKEFYQQKRINESVFISTVNDIKYKYNECMTIYGVDGIREGSFKNWYVNIFSMKIFGLGRFQYGLSTFGFEKYEKDGNVVKKGEYVLYLHIPSSGVSLTREERYRSYALAREFYKDIFGQKPIPVVSRSWLLYPENEKFMSPSSNIIDFKRDFEIIEVEDYDDFNAISAWVFGKEKVDLDTMPQNTSLQKNIKQHLKNGGKLGRGYGVFFI